MVTQELAAEARALCGDRTGAEREYIAQWSKLSGMTGGISTAAVRATYSLALFYGDDGRWEDADRYVAHGENGEIRDDFSLSIRLSAEARAAAHRGCHDVALRLAAQAVEHVDRGDLLNRRALIRRILAEILDAAGHQPDAEAARSDAVALYLKRGNLTAAARASGHPGLSGYDVLSAQAASTAFRTSSTDP
jgi:hypothetical protein